MFVAAPKRPPGHSVQLPAPTRLYVPAGHTAAVALVDPGAHAYPAVQGVHTAAPAVALYCPAPHRVAFPEPAGHTDPGGHVSVQATVALGARGTVPYKPAGQGVQEEDEGGAKDPAGHGMMDATEVPGGHA